jgi:solute carrier family 44 protein 1 (choline transporter-like protein)
LLVAIVVFIYFSLVIESTQKQTTGEWVHYVNIVAFIWFTQFIFGCQHFVIAGTISKWYFAHDKTKLNAPIQTTFSHLLNFHLGSVCLGSMVITLVKCLKMIANSMQNSSRRSGSTAVAIVACCCSCIIEQIERFLKFLTRNAYIIVAKEGTPFVESAKRAFGLIFRHLGEIVALNHFGDLVLVVARLFVVAIAGLCGYYMMVSTYIFLKSEPVADFLKSFLGCEFEQKHLCTPHIDSLCTSYCSLLHLGL